jgi:hypothetical protein
VVRKHLSLWRDMATCRDMATGAQSLISSFQTQHFSSTPPSGPQGEPGGKSYPLQVAGPSSRARAVVPPADRVRACHAKPLCAPAR